MKHAKEAKTLKSTAKTKRKKILFIIIGIIILGIIAYIANDYIVIGKNKTTNLVINNRNVTGNLKKDILIENGEIYISKQDLGNFFDKYIYEDKDTEQIITTYNKKIAEIGFDKNVVTINGSEKTTYAHAIKKDDTIYLPISELKDVYDIEINNIESTKVLVIDSLSKEQRKAILNSNQPVKSSTKFIAKTVDRVKKGECVIVISNENGYAKIRTEDGKIGYVKSKKLANEVVSRQNMEAENKNFTGMNEPEEKPTAESILAAAEAEAKVAAGREETTKTAIPAKETITPNSLANGMLQFLLDSGIVASACVTDETEKMFAKHIKEELDGITIGETPEILRDWEAAQNAVNDMLSKYAPGGYMGKIIYPLLTPLKERLEAGERTPDLYNAIVEATR